MTRPSKPPLPLTVLNAIWRQPRTVTELRRDGVCSSAAVLRLLLREFVHHGIARCNQRKNQQGAPMIYGCAFDGGPNTASNLVNIRRRPKVLHTAACVFIKALREDAYTRAELMEITGLSERTTQSWLMFARKLGIVHIAAWDCTPSLGPYVPMYQLGLDKPTARRPVGKRHDPQYRRAAVSGRVVRRRQMNMLRALALAA